MPYKERDVREDSPSKVPVDILVMPILRRSKLGRALKPLNAPEGNAEIVLPDNDSDVRLESPSKVPVGILVSPYYGGPRRSMM